MAPSSSTRPSRTHSKALPFFSGFQFHDAKRKDERGQPSEPGDLFKQQIRQLADALFELLTDLRQVSPSTEARESIKGIPGPSSHEVPCTVFLADVPDTLRAKRKRVAEDLEQHCVKIVKDVPPPFDRNSHDQVVIEKLRRANLSVHLFDTFAGREISGGEQTYARRQFELALEHTDSQVIWVPRELDYETIEEPSHRLFLQELEGGKGKDYNYDFIRDAPGAIKRHLLEKVEQLRRADESKPALGSCLLVTHDKDTAHMLPVAGRLVGQGIQPYINQEDNEPRAMVRLFEERLRQVASLVVFYGRVSGDWVRERLDKAAKHVVLEGLELKLGVFAAPPEKPPEALRFSRGCIPVWRSAPMDSTSLPGPRIKRSGCGMCRRVRTWPPSKDIRQGS